jgi:hypothetical protein
MGKKHDEPRREEAKKVNVEIAPGNRSRLEAFVKTFKDNPERSRPAMTVTDVLNEALDEFFSSSGKDFDREAESTDEGATEKGSKASEGRKKR